MFPPSSSRAFALIALLEACRPAPPMTSDGSSTATGGTTLAGSATDTTAASGPSPTTSPTALETTSDALTSTSANTSTGTSLTDTGDSTGLFISPSDFSPCARAAPGGPVTSCTVCDPWAQDCPPGEKCSPWSSDGDDVWDTTKCVPIDPAPDPVGQPCTVLSDIATGVDSCDLGAMCWYIDPDTLMGTCVALCSGSPDAPMCPDGTSCIISHGGVILLCLPHCDPLAQNCMPGETCIPNPMDPSAFVCVVDGSGEEGQPFDPCTLASACDPGLFCAPPDLATECDPGAEGCCHPFCDLTTPNTCPGAMQQCLPWYKPGTAPAGLDDLGYCALP